MLYILTFRIYIITYHIWRVVYQVRYMCSTHPCTFEYTKIIKRRLRFVIVPESSLLPGSAWSYAQKLTVSVLYSTSKPKS